MIFKRLCLEFAGFDTDTIGDLKQMLSENCIKRKDVGPMADIVEMNARSNAGSYGEGAAASGFTPP